MCFVHVLLNALDLQKEGHEVKIIFEGESVKLPGVLEEEKNSLYLKAKKSGIVAGVCLACSKQLGVFDVNEKLDIPLLNDMANHAGVKPYTSQGYTVLTF